MRTSSLIALVVATTLLLLAGASGSRNASSSAADTIPPTVTVTRPNGGETLLTMGGYQIRWSARDNVGLARIEIWYSTDGGDSFHPIRTDWPGAGRQYLDWRVPCTPTSAGRVKVVALDAAGNVGSDMSDANFTIKSPADTYPPTVTVAWPNGGEILVAGGTYAITWNLTDNVCVASADLLLSTNGGATFAPIVTNLPPGMGSRSYTWTVPANLSTTAGRIKAVARDAAGNVGSDISNANFTIKPGTTDTVPPTVRANAF